MEKNLPGPTWCDLVDRFADHLRFKRKSELTIRNYTDDVRFFVDWFPTRKGKRAEVAQVTNADLVAWKEHMAVARSMAPRTVNRKLSAMASFLKWAQSLNITQAVRIPKKGHIEPELPRWLSGDEKQALRQELGCSRNQMHQDVVVLLLHTGLRVSELSALKWSKVTIQDQHAWLNVDGSGRKRRTIPLNKDARAALISLGYEEHKGQMKHVVFSQRGPLTVRGIQHIVEQFGLRAGLNKLTAHMLRHTFARELLCAGVSIPEAAGILGHESPASAIVYATPAEVRRWSGSERHRVDQRHMESAVTGIQVAGR